MNLKLLFKTVFFLALLLLLVLMGMNNKATVALELPPLLPKALKLQSAIMYFAFFGVGVLTGTMLTAGGAKGGGSARNKVEK